MQSNVKECVRKMSLDEKLAQMQGALLGRMTPEEIFTEFTHGVGAVGMFGGRSGAEECADCIADIQEQNQKQGHLPVLIHGEAVTGFNSGEATVFPSAIGLGATFDPQLVEEMADVIREQMLATGTRHALSPVMDVSRDPRWGRVGETYGEDPTLCARMSVAFVKGIQTDDLRSGIAATGKHFLGYANGEGGLNMSANPIPPKELREVYAKPFQAAITEAGLATIMNSYGSIDGEIIIQSKNVLRKLLRDELGFEGIVVSDYRSLDKAVDLKTSADPLDAGKKALAAGLDIELPVPFGYTADLAEAIRSGEVDESLIDEAVERILTLKNKLGLLEASGPERDLLKKAYYSKKAEELSLRAAREATVLLKNDGILPLKKTKKKIALIGAHADSIRLMFGCYTFPASLDMMLSGSMHDIAGMEKEGYGKKQDDHCYPGSTVRRDSEKVNAVLKQMYGNRTLTIREAIAEKSSEIEVICVKGCDFAGNDRSGFAEAVKTAEDADVAVMCLGGKYGWGSNCTVGEGIDTDRVTIPGVQEELLREVCETGVPVILVHMDTKPLSSEYAYEHCSAILEYWFPGESGGKALADILFGDYNPAGRLPITAVRNAGQIPLYAGQRRGSGYTNKESSGMTLCRYVEGTRFPLKFFGEGLSYTEFTYYDLEISSPVGVDGNIEISCSVRNSGSVDGDEVVQLYVSDLQASVLRPEKELAGFSRIFLKAGENKRITFSVKASQFAFLNENMDWFVEAGEMGVGIGSSSEDIRLKGSFMIYESGIIDGRHRGFYACVK